MVFHDEIDPVSSDIAHTTVVSDVELLYPSLHLYVAMLLLITNTAFFTGSGSDWQWGYVGDTFVSTIEAGFTRCYQPVNFSEPFNTSLPIVITCHILLRNGMLKESSFGKYNPPFVQPFMSRLKDVPNCIWCKKKISFNWISVVEMGPAIRS